MTSMLLTERKGLSAAGVFSRLLLRAVPRRDRLLLRVRGRGFLDHRAHDRLVGRDPVADELPLLPVPLLELDRAAPLVVHARQLDRLEEAEGAELLQALLVDVQVLETPPYLLAGQGLLAELGLRRADRLGVQDSVDDPAVVVHRAEARDVLEVSLVPAGVDELLDVLEDLEVRPARMEGGRDEALRSVARGEDVLFRAAPPDADHFV